MAMFFTEAIMEASFDTLAYVHAMENAGMDRKLAEAQAEALKQFESAQSARARQELATKADLSETKHEILKWVVGLLFAQTAIILTALGIAVAWLAR